MIRRTGAVLVLVSLRLSATAQSDVVPAGGRAPTPAYQVGVRLGVIAQPDPAPAGGPLSAFEYHDGTFTTSRGRVQPAALKLQFRSDPHAVGTPRIATLVVQTPSGAVRPDSVVSFRFDQRQFVNLTTLTADRGLHAELQTEYVEVFQDSGRIELYGYYPNRFQLFGVGNHYVLASYTPGVMHEEDLVRAYIWRRRGAPSFEVMTKVPPRGYGPHFERQIRSLFADRPDMLPFIDAHNIRRNDLPAAVKAYNAGRPIRFE